MSCSTAGMMAVNVVPHRRDDSVVTRKKAAPHSIHCLCGVFIPAEFDSGDEVFYILLRDELGILLQGGEEGHVVGIQVGRLRWLASYFDVEPLYFPMT